ncbi:VOC family protein [Agrilutibacter solisilvae]|uniref:VOC family protein n=1 Tax=Agrilutibacter solisilvae TaxID=2763317 RepID=A0A975ATE1_9GAMM|nr:VOC family protein [Lysobacter solisilvae]QSX78910.1 VOC family protein [Lysobacter solisilvae]
MVQKTQSRGVEQHAFVKGFHGVRYQVRDIARAVEFYTQRLGFTLEHQQPPAFASVVLGGEHVLLSGPEASGSRPMPDGQQQEPGGWNRVVLEVEDLPGFIAQLKQAGCISATRWSRARPAGRCRSRIRTAIRSSCSSRARRNKNRRGLRTRRRALRMENTRN